MKTFDSESQLLMAKLEKQKQRINLPEDGEMILEEEQIPYRKNPADATRFIAEQTTKERQRSKDERNSAQRM